MSDLQARHCKPCEGGIDPLSTDQANAMMAHLADNWALDGNGKKITAEFSFSDFDRTMPFINAVAWIAHREDHHPDIAFGYNYARISFTTHAINGLSENDFICAAKIDALMQG